VAAVRSSRGGTAPLLAAAVALVLAAPVATAQSPDQSGYWIDSSKMPWRNSSGQCWRASYWTPALATLECDPDLVPRLKPVAAATPPSAPPPASVPAPRPAPVIQKVTLSTDTLFDFDKSVVKPEGRRELDDLVAQLPQIQLEVILAVGHTDSVGSAAYNQKLSMRRAEAVKAYLIGKGVSPSRISISGKGETQPVADNRSRQGRALNRRVEVEIIGNRAVR